jgi:uncharacterized Zn finger protein
MPRENAAVKARRYLTEGRIILTEVTAGHVAASVRGDGAIYTATYAYGTWRCTCPARSDGCCHLKALRLVTAPEVSDAR